MDTITWKYPSCILRGDNSRGEFYSPIQCRFLLIYNFNSLGCGFDLDQLLCTRPGQLVVGGGSPRSCRPAALLQVIALFPSRRDLLQDLAEMKRTVSSDRPLGALSDSIATATATTP
jgi:hypothetical protein